MNNTNISKNFRDNLRRLTGRRGAKHELVKEIGMNPRILYGYLNGENVPGLKQVERLAKHLKVSPLELLSSRPLL